MIRHGQYALRATWSRIYGGDLAALAGNPPEPSPSIQPRPDGRTGADSDGLDTSPVTESESTASPIACPTATGSGVMSKQRWNGLPARADAVVGGEVARMGLAREHHALELGVGQQPVGNHALGQQRAVGRRGVRHCGHGAGLHERGGMLDGVRNPHHARPPWLVGPGGRSGCCCILGGGGRSGLDGELDDRTPVMGLRRRRRGGRIPRRLGGRDLHCRRGRGRRRRRALAGRAWARWRAGAAPWR